MLRVEKLVKTVAGGRRVLDGIDFQASPGEFIGILGSSGAGKSLTLRSITALTPLDSGQVWFDGTCVTRATGRELRRLRSEIGMIFQGLHLVKRLSVLENVMIGGLGRIHPLRSWLYGFTDREAEAAAELLAQVQLAGFEDRIAGTLSGGELQRVAIARAMFQRPKLYLADEPVAALDPQNAVGILEILQPLSRSAAVIATFHQTELARRYCTRIIGVRAGRVIYDGSPYLSTADIDDLYDGRKAVSVG